MPPTNGARNYDDLYARLDALEEKTDGQHERCQNRMDRIETSLGDVRREYVTDKSLGYQLATFRSTLDKLEKALNWFVAIVVSSFLAAVARIVYVNTK